MTLGDHQKQIRPLLRIVGSIIFGAGIFEITAQFLSIESALTKLEEHFNEILADKMSVLHRKQGHLCYTSVKKKTLQKYKGRYLIFIENNLSDCILNSCFIIFILPVCIFKRVEAF